MFSTSCRIKQFHLVLSFDSMISRESQVPVDGEARVRRLQQGSSAAATTLLKLMLDPATPPSTRARCSESVLGLASKAIELEDIESRLAALERATEASKQTR